VEIRPPEVRGSTESISVVWGEVMNPEPGPDARAHALRLLTEADRLVRTIDEEEASLFSMTELDLPGMVLIRAAHTVAKLDPAWRADGPRHPHGLGWPALWPMWW
jgi:hypothetical protein